MSASLVGSEMCIRDRGPGDCQKGPRELPEGAPGIARKGTRGVPEGAPGCLLYTSDAADDM
eukprot:8523712-Alexandrium_andersonii.AAC.1